MSYSKYYLYKKQQSTDGGVTWSDVTPLETQASGDPIATYSTLAECEYVQPTTAITYHASEKLNVNLNNFTPAATAETFENGVGQIEFVENVTSIGSVAFSGKTALTSIDIPDSVTSIGYYTFSYCSSLTSVTLGNSVTNIGSTVFSNCSSLTSITIPNSVTSIGSVAFYRCSGLTSIEIPNSVTSIGTGAFSQCTSLSSIVIPNSVTSIGSGAFELTPWYQSYSANTDNIYNSVVYINNVAYEAVNKSMTGVLFRDNTIGIADGAFENCSSLTSVTIPDSITTIGVCAFMLCASLSSMTVDANNTVYDSRNNCNAIIKTATNTLIAGCHNTVIPNTVTSIGNYAFNSCTSLSSITIPDSVTEIGYQAFSYCHRLTSCTIGSGVTSIGGIAFHECTSLTSITIPDSVTEIGYQAFNYCSGLTSITINATTPPTLVISAFDNTSDCPIYVLAESVDTYKTATNWSTYADRIFAIP